MQRAKPRKRPCRVCRRWFLPDGRLKNRQKTCGNPECQREWHSVWGQTLIIIIGRNGGRYVASLVML